MTVRISRCRVALWLAMAVVAVPVRGLDPIGTAPAGVAFRFAPVAERGSVGRAAGMLCLPNGRLKLARFARSEEFAGRELAMRLTARGISIDRQAGLAVALMNLEGRLCARKWGALGMGDRDTLTGQTRFQFNWTDRSGSVHRLPVAVNSTSDRPLAPDEIFGAALDLLAADIGSAQQ